MRKMLTLAVCTLIGAALCRPSYADNDAFEGYAETCGYPIVFSPTRSISQAVLNGTGEALIILDPVLNEKSESARRLFLIAHECAHHLMGHAGPQSMTLRAMSERIVRDQELSADCWAAETLARLGYERSVQIMSDRFGRSGLYSPGLGYPAGVQRSTIIRKCAESGRRARLGGVAPSLVGEN